jgi:hypothetical protein
MSERELRDNQFRKFCTKIAGEPIFDAHFERCRPNKSEFAGHIRSLKKIGWRGIGMREMGCLSATTVLVSFPTDPATYFRTPSHRRVVGSEVDDSASMSRNRCGPRSGHRVIKSRDAERRACPDQCAQGCGQHRQPKTEEQVPYESRPRFRDDGGVRG